jgi:hypothetical protein
MDSIARKELTKLAGKLEGAVMNVVASVRKAAAPAAMIGALLATALHAPAFAGPASKAASEPVQCSDEAVCIDLANGSVTREPGLLTFRPKLGPVVAFRDAAPDCSMVLDPEDGDPVFCSDYRLSAYQPAANIWIIEATNQGAIVLSGDSGAILADGFDVAAFSPDGGWIALFRSITEAQLYAIEVSAVSGDGLKTDFAYQSSDAEADFSESTAEFIGWRDSEKLELSVNVRQADGGTLPQAAFVVHSDTGWRLERSWSK